LLPLALNLLLRHSAALAASVRSLHVSGALLLAAAAVAPFTQFGSLLEDLHRSSRAHDVAAAISLQPGGAVLGGDLSHATPSSHIAAERPCLTPPAGECAILPDEPSRKPARPFVDLGLERGPPLIP